MENHEHLSKKTQLILQHMDQIRDLIIAFDVLAHSVSAEGKSLRELLIKENPEDKEDDIKDDNKHT
jgi:hypothetical protein